MIMNKEQLDKQMNAGQYLIWAANRINELEKDCKYLLSFAPHRYPPEKMSPMFYKTGTYEGDVEISERIKKIKSRLPTTKT